MAQPEIVKDIEARVKDTGDTMTGNLTAPTFIGSLQGNASSADKLNTNAGGLRQPIYFNGGKPVVAADDYVFYDEVSGAPSGDSSSPFVLKIGDTMTGNLTAPKFIGSLQGNASSSTYSTYTYFRDTRNANEMPLDMLKGVSLHLKSNSADGLNDGLSYHPILMLRDWNDLSGGPFAELTITGNQNLYFRSSTTNADNTWNPWRKVLTDYNYTSILNNTYLPLTGGTLSGSVKIAGGTFNYSTIQNGTSNSDRNVWFSTSGSRGIPCYNDNFKYNPSTNTLTVGSITGNAATADSATNATNVNIANDTSSKIYVLGATTTGNTRIYRESSVYMQNNVLFGAAWNDYAEYRESNIAQPGRCIIENGDDTLRLSTERLQRGAEIISDTFGFAIGETDTCKTPIAVSGRVLAYGYEDREQFKSRIGYPVCSGPNGTVSIMTDEEEQLYPSRIIGYISAVPDYEIWGTGNVKVDGRIWIRIK